VYLCQDCCIPTVTSVVLSVEEKIFIMTPKGKDLPPPSFPAPTEPSETVPNPGDKQARKSHSERQELLGWQESEGRKSSEGRGEDDPPVSAFAEPSDPSDEAPGEHPHDQLTNQQEENPQVIMKTPLKQKTKL
jgi:hypothetical protein